VIRVLVKRFSRSLSGGRWLRAVAMLHVFAVTSLFSHGAFAYTCVSGGYSQLVLQVPASIVIPRDLPVGSVLPGATYTATALGSGTAGVSCTFTGGESAPVVYTNDTGGGNATGSVIPIGNTGIGFILTSLLTGGTYKPGTVNITASAFQPGSSTGCTATPCYLVLGPTVQLQLVKMQPIVGNPTLPGQTVYMDATVGGKKASTVALSQNIQITSQTCTVTTPSIPVDLGQVSALNKLSTLGSFSDQVGFNIGVDCAGLATNLGITFTDVADPGNTTNLLTLSSDSTAQGVNIQILKGTTPVLYGPDSSIAGNTNQISIGASGSSMVNIPLYGRYIRTGAIKPGLAKGVATFTMSYQ